MHRSKFVVQSLAALALISSSAAMAADSGWYVGASLGQSTVKDFCDGLPATVSCDEKDTGWKLFGGHQFSKNLAVEFGWVDLGEATLSGPGGAATAETSGFGASVIGAIPLGDSFSLFARAGGNYLKTEWAGVVSADDSGIEFNLGLGAQFDFGKSIAVRAEWERYFDVGGDNTGEADVDLLSVGAIFLF